jgi:hypothetical protein
VPLLSHGAENAMRVRCSGLLFFASLASISMMSARCDLAEGGVLKEEEHVLLSFSLLLFLADCWLI